MKNILLVEDDQDIAEMYKVKLNMFGFKVNIASNGEECLNILKKYVPNLILLDIILPKINGFQIIKEIKKKVNLRKIPIILLTNLGESEININQDIIQILGIHDYLIKTKNTPAEVANKVIQVLKRLESDK